MKLSHQRYSLNLVHPFTISVSSRSQTPLVLVQIEHDGLVGYGEASLPPYLPENQEGVSWFLNKINLSQFTDPTDIASILEYIMAIEPGQMAAKAAADIALHDLYGKYKNLPVYEYFQSIPENMPPTSCTLGMASDPVLETKVREASPFHILKIKLGGADDRHTVQTIRRYTQKPLYVDANQGWKNPEEALTLIIWLESQGVVLIEQPLGKENLKDQRWLHERSPLPIIADESCQGANDLGALEGVFSGINIKLMKCGGLGPASQLITQSRKLNMKTMIGCMNESSCAVMAAAALAPQTDYVDLDGPFLVSNNPFDDPILSDGKIILQNLPGLGIQRRVSDSL